MEEKKRVPRRHETTSRNASGKIRKRGQSITKSQAQVSTHFFNPGILEKFRDSTSIETLFMVEGEFKSFKGIWPGLTLLVSRAFMDSIMEMIR